MPIATLSIDLEARLARFEQGMNRANVLLDKLDSKATGAGRRITEIFAGNLAANAALQVVERFAGFVPQVLDGVLAIKDLAEATGSTVEQISALDDIARRAGGNLQQVEGVLLKFNAALRDADGQDEVSQVLKAIGLDAAALRRIDPADALQKTAVAFGKFAEDGARARAESVVFGKGVKDASTLLRDLADAGKLSATVTTQQAEAFDRFDKELGKTKASLEGAGRALLELTLPAVNELFDVLRGKGPGTLDATLAVPLQAIAVLGANVGFVIKGIVTELGGLAIQAGNVAKLDFAGAAAVGRLMREDAARARADFDALERRLLQLGSVTQADYSLEGLGRNRQVDLPRLPYEGKTAKLKEAARSFEDYQQTLTKSIADLIGKTDTVRLAELNAQLDKLAELSAAGLDPQIVEQVQRMLVPPQGAAAGPPLSAEMERVNELLGRTDSAQLRQASRDAALLRAEFSATTAGTQRWLELSDALLDVEERINTLAGIVPELAQQTDESAQQMRNTIEGALGSTLSSTLRGEFDNIGQLWRNLLVDMASRALAADILGALFKSTGGSGSGATSSVLLGSLGKLFGGLFGSAKGNAFTAAGVVPFATGGVVDRMLPFTFGNGRLGVMGENGPEAVLPLKRGPGGVLGVRAVGAGTAGPAVVINQVINAAPGTSRNDLMQAMTVAKAAAVAEVEDRLRRGRLALA